MIECLGKKILPNGDAECQFYDTETGEEWEEVIKGFMEDDPEPLYRVTYFSAWHGPEHHENLTAAGRDRMVYQGKQQQYKCVVSLMTEDEPESC